MSTRGNELERQSGGQDMMGSSKLRFGANLDTGNDKIQGMGVGGGGGGIKDDWR